MESNYIYLLLTYLFGNIIMFFGGIIFTDLYPESLKKIIKHNGNEHLYLTIGEILTISLFLPTLISHLLYQLIRKFLSVKIEIRSSRSENDNKMYC